MKPVSRSSGRSATAAAAYRNAELITDLRTGERHDYRRRTGVEAVIGFAPEGCRIQPSAELWNRAEAAEKRKNSTVAREVLVALPCELGQAQRAELVERITAKLAQRYGVAGTAAIHAPDREGDQRNWHAHILMTTRRIDPATGELGAKTRELDSQQTGPAEVVWIRQMVEQEGNAALERAGHAARLDCRSLADQGIDRAPTVHEGPRVTQIRRECEREKRDPLGICDRIAANDSITEVAQMRAELVVLDAKIYQLEVLAPAQAAAAAERLRIEQQTAAGRRLAELREQLPAAREAVSAALDRLAELRGMTEPRAVSVAKAQWRQVERLGAEAQQQMAGAARWRKAHLILSWMADKLGIRLPTDRAASEALEAARSAYSAHGSSDAKAQAVAWRQTRAELASIEQRLPELSERQRQIEDELLRHAGPEPLRELVQQQLEHARRAEQDMEPDDCAVARERRQELAERIDTTTEPAGLVQLYRDTRQNAEVARELAEVGAHARAARERLAATKETLRPPQDTALRHQPSGGESKPNHGRGPRSGGPRMG